MIEYFSQRRGLGSMICRVPRFRISGSGWFQRKSCPMQWQSKILGRITFFDIQFITTNLVNRGKKYVKSHVHTLKKRRKIDQLKKIRQITLMHW